VEHANNSVRTSAVPRAELGFVLRPISAEGLTQEAPPSGCKTGQVHFMKLIDISIDQVLNSAAAFAVPTAKIVGGEHRLAFHPKGWVRSRC
jgi:hypothetical protein